MGTDAMDSELHGGVDLERAAKLLGVHYQTVYRWVRSGVLPATRLAGGYRVRVADIEALARNRQARRPLSYTGRARDWDRLREQFHAALLAGDDTGARRVFEMVHLARVPILEQCEELLAPSLRRIGDDWAAGELSGARVRLAAAICERSLDWAVGRLASPEPARGVALVISPKGDEHRLPSLMAGAVLRDEAWAVREVHGVDPSDVKRLAERLRPELAVVSVTMPGVVDLANEVRVDLRESLGIPVLVGGAGQSLETLHDEVAAVSSAA
jgi:excisionase family DNA binding protein